MRSEILYKISLALLPPLYTGLTRLWFSTCREEAVDERYLEECRAGGPVITAFWHYSTYYITHKSRGRAMTAMVSPSRDGAYMARVLERLGHRTVRGSRRKGGLAALREMENWVAQGRSAAIVADGSQGPALQAQAGAILLASHTGAPIVPVVCAADRYYLFSSWDRSMVPKPFARVCLMYGEPLRVAAGIRAADLQQHRLELEQRLNRLYTRAWQRFGKEGHVRDF